MWNDMWNDMWAWGNDDMWNDDMWVWGIVTFMKSLSLMLVIIKKKTAATNWHYGSSRNRHLRKLQMNIT